MTIHVLAGNSRKMKQTKNLVMEMDVERICSHEYENVKMMPKSVDFSCTV